MALTYHINVNNVSTFTTDSKETTKSKLNNNFSTLYNNDNSVEARFEDTFDDMCGTGILNGMVGTINAGTLTFAVTAGAALIGARVECAAGNVTVLANQTSKPIYFCNDGTWTTTLPTTKSYLVWGIYTSNASAITSLTRTATYPSLQFPLLVTSSGNAKTNLDILSLTNTTNASDMDGTSTSILFNQYYYHATTPAVVNAGRITVGTETDWTSTASTQDAYMAFSVVVDGTVTERMRISSSGNVGIGGIASGALLHVSPTNQTTAAYGIKFGTDTNLYRSAADTLKTDDSLIVGDDLSVTDDLTVGDDLTVTDNISATRYQTNTWYVDAGESISSAVSAATAGDIVLLGPGTHVLSSALTLNKSLTLMGMGRGRTTVTYTATNGFNIFTDNITIQDLSYIVSANSSSTVHGIRVDKGSGANCTNIRIVRVDITMSNDNTAGLYGVYWDGGSGVIEQVSVEITATTVTSTCTGFSIYQGSDQVGNESPAYIRFCRCNINSSSGNARGIIASSSSATYTKTVNVFGCMFLASGVVSYGCYATGANMTLYVRNTFTSGSSYDLCRQTSATFIVAGCTLANGTTSGTITYSGTIVSEDGYFSDDVTALGTIKVLSNSEKFIAGAGSNMSMYYNGTNGYIETNLVAASDLRITTGTAKTLVLDTVVYDDLKIPLGSLVMPGVSDPSLVAYNVNGGGIDTYLYEFEKNDIASFTVQLPHSYKEGENITAHIHWTPGARGDEENGATVGWKMDYSWANIDGTFNTMATLNLSDACDGTDHKHQITPSGTITGTSKTISSMLICNVKRTDTGSDDTWAGTTSGELPMLLEIDFHFPIERIGSRTTTTA